MDLNSLSTITKIVVGIFAILGFWVTVGKFLWEQILPAWNAYRQKQALEKKLLRGHYTSQKIQNSTRHYIWPKCSTDVDPAHRDEIRQALVATTSDLRERVDFFLCDGDAQRHLIILADSGMGKTSFLLNYFAYNERRSKRHRLRIALVYLGSTDCDDKIKEIDNPEDTVLFLDALDEDVKAIKSHRERIAELMTLTNLILEMLDRFLTRNRVECALA